MHTALRVREGFIQGAGARIYFKTLGRGVPLLLLHGGPGADHSDFLPALRPLARHCQLVLIDERGSGRSERLKDPKGYTLDRMVKDIEHVREHLKLPQIVVLGHSFGGILAQAYAVQTSKKDFGIGARRHGLERTVHRYGLSQYPQAPAGATSRLGWHGTKGPAYSKPTARTRRSYAAASAQALAPYMYAKAPPRRFKQPLDARHGGTAGDVGAPFRFSHRRESQGL